MECPVPTPDPSARWLGLAEEVLLGMRDWRASHPRATWKQIEAELDARLARLRGQVLRDAAQASPAADFRGATERPPCPSCGTPLRAAGQHRRRLTTDYEQAVEIERTYGRCPACGAGVFPPRRGA
jgi:hypothetical protein